MKLTTNTQSSIDDGNKSQDGVSNIEQKLRELDKRDRLLKSLLFAIVAVVAIFNMLTIFRTQIIIEQHEQQAVLSDENSKARQTEIKNYIKCILLLRFDTDLTVDSPREKVEQALDNCAKVE